jgi:hypothetical protein
VDSEEEGIFTVGCAGGIRVQSDIPMKRVPDSGLCLDFKFEGILGGHSGIEINNGLANANALMGRFFMALKKACGFKIITLSGGVKENVIPKDGMFSLLIENPDLMIVEDIKLSSEVYAVGFAKGSELTAKVNAAIKTLFENGKIAELAAKYGFENVVQLVEKIED